MIQFYLKKLRFFSVFFGCITLTPHLLAYNTPPYFDDLELLELSNINVENINNQHENPIHPSTQDTRSLLINIVQLAELFDTDLTKLYINTAPARSKNPIYLPRRFSFYNPHKTTFDFLCTFQMHSEVTFPFRNRINFDFISQEGKEQIKTLIEAEMGPGRAQLYDEGLELFEAMSVQERRVVFSTLLELPLPYNFFLRTELSCIGIERNYWMEEKLQQKGLEFFKKFEAIFEALPYSEPSENDLSAAKIKKILEEIPYTFGFGDPCVQLGYLILQKKYLQMIIGVECIPPMSALTEQSPRFPLEEETTILGEIERLNRINRHPILGSNGHWGIGCFFETKIPIFEGLIDFFTKMSFDKILAREVVRDISIEHEVFPRLMKVESLPGNIIHLTCGLHAQHSGWSFDGGYDLYKQDQENLSFVCTAHNRENANLAKACQPEAIQHSLFSNIAYQWKKENIEWISCGLNGSVSLKEKGIGPHWNVGLKVRLLV